MTPPTGWLRFGRWYLALVGIILLAAAAFSMGSYALAASRGATLVFSQEDIETVGPAPAPPAPAAPTGNGGHAVTSGDEVPPTPPTEDGTGGVQYVDLIGLAAPVGLGAIAIVGALAMGGVTSRSRWLATAGVAAAGIAGLFPAGIGLWAASYYGMGNVGQLLPYIGASAILAGLALRVGWEVWRPAR